MPNNGYTQAVPDALKDGPKTSIELVRITGIDQVADWRGDAFLAW